MKEQIISYETAKLAAEKGFSFKTEYEYLDLVKHKEIIYGHGKYHDDILGEELVPEKLGVLTDNPSYYKYVKAFYRAPTQALLQKWLREIHDLHICILRAKRNANEKGFVYKLREGISWDFELVYEDCLEAALITALKNIKK